MNFKKMGTISTTYQRCLAENVGISKHLIRELATSGRIPSIMAGTTRIISFDVLMEYLDSGIVKGSEK